jgi:hypothetical protein
LFKSNEALFHATNAIVASLDQSGHRSEAEILKNGLASLNGLTDGWALFLDAIQEVEKSDAFTDPEKKTIAEIHDAVYEAVYRRKRKAWWKFG